MFMRKFLEHLLASFKACKRKHAILIKKGLIINYAWFAFCIKRRLKFRGDFAERQLRKARQSLNVAAVLKKDVYEEEGTDLLRGFLFATALNVQTKGSFNHMNEVRYKVATMYRRHLEALDSRANVMSELFDKEIGYLNKYYSDSKKGTLKERARKKQTLRELSNINPQIKQRVLQLYMARMKFYYTIKTLKWFLLFRSDQYDDMEAVQEMVALVQKRARQLYEIDQTLFDKIELPVLIPDAILQSQKAHSKRMPSPAKKKGLVTAAA